MARATGEVEVVLPTLHADQVRAYELQGAGEHRAVRCGRRWGKTDLGKVLVADPALRGEPTAWFAPGYKLMVEVYNDLEVALKPVIGHSSKNEGVMRLRGGGRIDYWTLENENAGRSRKYKRVVVDEGAFTKPNMIEIWERSILPTLLDYGGEAWVLSNTNGVDPRNFFWKVCNEPRWGFRQFHAPSWRNPYVPLRRPDESYDDWLVRRRERFAKIKADNDPLVYEQEYRAEFVDWSGHAFFARDKLLENGEPIEVTRLDAVFAVVDTATKTGRRNDGTGVVYYGLRRRSTPGVRLVVLDWDLQQIEGALLEVWLPTVFETLERYAVEYGAVSGSLGAWIEDKSSGMVLIQQAARRRQPARAIDSKLTSVGKSERAIAVSGYHYRGEIKMSRRAYEKTVNYKGVSRNHLLGQVVDFRVGDRDPLKEDDLLDCYCYGVAIGLGDSGGF